MSSTINCIVCFEKATCWGGHVHKKDEGESIIAGFCRQHFKTPLKENFNEIINEIEVERGPSIVKDCKGCFGEWKAEMGTDKSFGQVMFIDSDGLHPADEEETK